MNEHQALYYLVNKYLSRYMKETKGFNGVVRLDAHQFWVNRNLNWGKFHNIEIIKIKTRNTHSSKELKALKSELKSTLNMILKSIEGQSYKPVLHIILKDYHACIHQITPSLFPNSTHQ